MYLEYFPPKQLFFFEITELDLFGAGTMGPDRMTLTAYKGHSLQLNGNELPIQW